MRSYSSSTWLSEVMMYGFERDDEQLKQRWKQLLLQYCKLDTLSMVFVWEHWFQRIGG